MEYTQDQTTRLQQVVNSLSNYLEDNPGLDEETRNNLQGFAHELTASVVALQKAEASLLAAYETQEFSHTLFEQSPDAIFIISPEGAQLNANHRAATMLGYTKEEIQKLTIKDVSAQNLESETVLKRLIDGETIPPYERLFKKKNGEIFPVELHVSLMRDRQGRPYRIQSIAHDISSRKATQEKLHLSEERFTKAFELSPYAIVITRLRDGVILETNGRWNQAFGYSAKDMIGKRTVDLGIWETTKQRQRFVKTVKENGGVKDWGTHFRTKSGELREVSLSAEIITVGSDKLLITTIRDVTESKRAEAALRLENERFQRFFEANIVGIVIGDATGNITMANDYYLNILGVTRQDLLDGRVQWKKFTPPEWLPADEKAIRELRERGVCEPYEKEYERVDGARVPVYIADAMLPGPEEQIAAFVIDLTERKQVEQALWSSQEYARSTLDSISETYILLDRQWRYLYANKAACDAIGLSREQILGRTLWELYPDIVETELARQYKHAMENHVVVRFEFHYLSNNTWWENRFYPASEGLAVFASNITEQVKTLKALRENEERLSLALSSTETGVWEWNLSTKTFFGTPKCDEILGRNLASTPAESLIDVFLEEDRQAVASSMLEIIAQHIPININCRAMRPDGKLIWLAILGRAEYDEHGQPFKVIGIVRDCTAEKQAEEEQRRSRKILAQAGKMAQLGVWEIQVHNPEDLNADPLTWSDETCRIFGYEPGKIQETNTLFFEHVHPDDRQKVSDSLTQALAAKTNYQVEHRIIRADGVERVVFEHAEIAYDPHGQPLEIIGAVQDITEQKKNEAQVSRHLAELEALYENGLVVSRLFEPAEIGRQIINTFARYLSWHHVAIRLRRETSDNLELVAFSQPGLNENDRLAIEQRANRLISKVGQGLSGWAVQTGEAIRTGNVRTHPQYVDTYPSIQSGLYMPLKIGERVIGCISVESEQSDAFSAEDERLLATLANQAAAAFENARLYQAAQLELEMRKRIQDQLSREHAQLKSLIQTMPDMVWLKDPKGIYLTSNPKMQKTLGLSEDQILGKTDYDLFTPEVAEQFRRQDQMAFEVGEPVKFEEAHLSSKIAGQNTSSQLLLETTKIPIYDADNKLVGTLGIARDITERRQAEAILKKRLELMDFSAHNSLDILLQKVLDDVEELTKSRVGFFHLIGDDQNTIQLQAWSSRTIRELCPMGTTEEHRPLDQAGVWAESVRAKRPIIHNDYQALPNKRGVPPGHVSLTRELVVPITRNGQIVALVGVGNKPTDYTDKDLEVALQFTDYCWDVIERKKMELTLAEERNSLARHVEERTLELSLTNAELERANRLKDEFLSTMSHELRTPLNAIISLSESLQEGIYGDLSTEQSDTTGVIAESGHHLLELINDILDLSKVQAGKLELNIEAVAIEPVCQAALRMVKEQAAKKSLKVSFSLDSRIHIIHVDERRLKQMLVNLLSNAVKFTPEGGQIGLDVTSNGGGNIHFTVWDTGIGIPEEKMPKLFQPFVQIDSSLSRQYSGTGLGLVLVRQLAERQGGSVAVESEYRKGSRFSFALPGLQTGEADLEENDTQSVRGAERSATARKAIEQPGALILVVEDNAINLKSVSDYLHVKGYRVAEAVNGFEALERAREYHPDLILMDIQMPEFDGIEATRKLRAQPAFVSTPIIALTALAMPGDRERCLNAGANDYMTKPVDLKKLVATIQQLLGKGAIG